ncbi:hypothetical protein F4W70_20035 [Pseudomonas cannabina]|nr:hypothetical protein [Pseudomonas cannabina]KAA8706826.1 hypothetical protein F4W70_20035 [Pseudomonas cannabina]
MTSRHWLFLALLATGYGLALVYGSLAPIAAVGFGLLLVAWLCVARSASRHVSLFGHLLFIMTGLALATHLLPGFNNAKGRSEKAFSSKVEASKYRRSSPVPLQKNGLFQRIPKSLMTPDSQLTLPLFPCT